MMRRIMRVVGVYASAFGGGYVLFNQNNPVVERPGDRAQFVVDNVTTAREQFVRDTQFFIDVVPLEAPADAMSYYVAFDTLSVPGKIVATKVTLTTEVIDSKGGPFRVDLADNPLYPELVQYVQGNPPQPRKEEGDGRG